MRQALILSDTLQIPRSFQFENNCHCPEIIGEQIGHFGNADYKDTLNAPKRLTTFK